MRARSVRLTLVLFVVGVVATLASAQPPEGWGGPRIVHYKVCARCGYKTENLSEITCPNCSGRGAASAPQENTPPSFTGFQPSSGEPKQPERKRLTLAENVRLGVLIAVGSGVLLTLFFGGFFLVNYLIGAAKVKRAKKPVRRSRRWDDEDDDY